MAVPQNNYPRVRSMESMSAPQRPTVSKSNLTMKRSKNSPANSQILKESLCKSIKSSGSQDQMLPNDADGYIMKGTYNILNNAPRGSRSSLLGRPAPKNTEKVDTETLKDFYTFGDPIMMSNGKIGYLNNSQNTQENQDNQQYFSYPNQGSQHTDLYYYPDYTSYYAYNYQYPQPIYCYPYLPTNNHTFLHVNMDPFAPPCYYTFDYVDENNNYCYQGSSSNGSYQQFQTYPNMNEQCTKSASQEDCSTKTSTTYEDCSTQTSSEYDAENSEEGILSSESNSCSVESNDNTLSDQMSCSMPVG